MKPVRKKQDSISIILDVLNILLIGGEQYHIKGKVVLKIDKMSRLFCFLEDKYFSIIFPFDIEQRTEETGICRIFDAALNMEIDSRLIVLLRRMLERIDFEERPIDEIIENAYLDVGDEGYTGTEISNCFSLILRLFSMELGYVRYDYDPEHQNGTLHPLYHLDVNYSSNGTYKIGIKKEMKETEFVDLLDRTTACRYIV